MWCGEGEVRPMMEAGIGRNHEITPLLLCTARLGSALHAQPAWLGDSKLSQITELI